MARRAFLVALCSFVGTVLSIKLHDDLLIPRSDSSRTSSLSATLWINSTSTSDESSTQTTSTSTSSFSATTIFRPPGITTISYDNYATQTTCIHSELQVTYVTSTTIIPGSTITLAANQTVTTTDELTTPSFCRVRLGPATFSEIEPAPVPSFSAFSAESAATVSIIVTKKTSVLVQSTPANTLEYNLLPTLRPGGEAPPIETGSSSGDRGSGNHGGGNSGEGGGGSAPDKPNPSSVVPGLGAVISSIFAGHQIPSTTPGGIVSPTPGSSVNTGGSYVPPTSPEGQGHNVVGGGNNGGSGGISGATNGHALGAVVNNIPVVAGPSDVVIGGTTFNGIAPTSVTVGSDIFTVLPTHGGVVLPGGMTITPPQSLATPAPSNIQMSGYAVTYNLAIPGKIEVAGSTYQLPMQGSSTIVIGGSTMTLMPNAIVDGTSTAALPTTAGPAMPQYTALTVDGIPFDIGTGVAVVDGHTVQVGAGAPTSTFMVGSETIIAGPDGLSFPHTTVAPLGASPMPVTADGMVFSTEPSDVVISGTTYFFSHATTVVIGTETISIGPSGVGLATTTIAPSLTASIAPPSSTTIPEKSAPTNGQTRLRFQNGVLVAALIISMGTGLLMS